MSVWGFNAYGQAAPPGLTDATAIAAGYLHSAALRSNGTVLVWGDNSYGQTNVPPGLSNVVAIAAGDFHTFAMRADGSVVGWGDNRFGQTDVPSAIVDALGVSAGYYHGLALIPFNRLHLRSILSGLLIEWRGTGILECAPTPSGPYHEIPTSLQSYTNSDFSEQARFFRLKRE